MALRGKVSVGEADRVNTESSAVKGQSDEDVRREDVKEMRRIESTNRPRASSVYETSRDGVYRSQSSGEAGTGDRRKVIDSSEKGSKIDGDAQRLMGLRSEAGLQGAKTATLGSDESAEIWGDRVVTDGISRPMATDGKGEEHSPTNDREKNEQEPVVARRRKVSVGEAGRVNTKSSAVKAQSDGDVR